MRTSARRLGAVAITITAALVSGSALVAPAAQAAPNSYAYSGGTWLADQLTGGLVHNDQYDFDDYGLSLDVYFALTDLATRPATSASILDAIEEDPEAYISYESDHYAGSTGKLAAAVQTEGEDPTDFGGVDLVTRLEGLVDTTHEGEIGRGVDQSSYGDNSNTIGQAWVVRALVGADSARAGDSLGFLLQQQCTDGFFRVKLEAADADSAFTCDAAQAADRSPSIDATAFAIEALESARDQGVSGLDDDITDAADWLVDAQAADGSFSDEGTANSNSTGLAAAALAQVGRTGAAGSAAAWLQKLQVTDAVAESTALSNELGAVAFDAAALSSGKQEGITAGLRDQWRRATAQAVVALDAALPATTLGAAAPTGYQHGGSTVTLRTSGLEPGEHFTVALGTVRSVTGIAGTAGTGAVRVLLPRSTRTYAVVVTGSRSVRTGSSMISVLGPRTFSAKVRSRPIKRARTQQVTVAGLAPGEKARLFYRGTAIWSGAANADGKVVRSFGSGRSLGTKTVVLRGMFTDRSVTTTFRVVR